MKYRVIKPVDHGDVKTNAVFPERRPTLQPGDVVTFVAEFNNYYGHYFSVESDRSRWIYDVPPDALEKIDE